MSKDVALSSSRRKFLRRSAVAGLASALPAGSSLFASSLPDAANSMSALATAPDAPALHATTRNLHPIGSNAFYLLPLGSIRPTGWLKAQLLIQANGLSGHLDETWPDVGTNSSWLGGTGESWERGPYYLDGLIPLAWLLDDARLKAKAQRFVDWTLTHQQANGMIGPVTNDDWWPRIVMLKALTQYQELTGDARVIPLIDKYFQHQLAELPKRPLRDWGKFRWQDEALSAIWLFNRTGAAYLLDLLRLLHQQGYDWMAQYADFKYTGPTTAAFLKLAEGNGLKDPDLATHGVNNAQAIKTGPVWWLLSGNETDRSAARKMLEELDRYHGLPNGMFSCDEHLDGRDPSQGSELCSVVESMFSLEQALAVTGDPWFGDRLERLAYNALPGTFTDDMWAHQYNQEPNQVECSLHRRPWVSDGPESNLYGLEPNFGCCTANFSQGWPKFANSLVMLAGAQESDVHDGLVAAAYAPCEVRMKFRDTTIFVAEETEYPFRGTVRFAVNPSEQVRFPFQFRIPAWAAGATIRVNGEAQPPAEPGVFARVERYWRYGDRVEIAFPMQPRISRWFNDSVAVERGPLVFSLGIGEDWVKLRERGMTADWQVFPTAPWNYAVDVDSVAPAKTLQVTEAEVGEGPFTAKHAPVRITAKARKVPEWRAEDGAANPVPQSPVATSQPEETITLIPYAAAKLRITAFPQCKA